MASTSQVPTFKLASLFSAFEIAHLMSLRKQPDFHRQAVAYITPMMPRIDRVVGHKNAPGYLAYAIEHAFNQITQHQQ